jgi:hypothetical protein
MVSQQGEQIQRIDANTEDVVDNVEGAQRELMKYWSRVQGNRWLVAKMFGVLMICTSAHFHLVTLCANPRSFPPLGSHFWIAHPRICISPASGKTGHGQSRPVTLAAYFSILQLYSYIFFYPFDLQTRPRAVRRLIRFNRLPFCSFFPTLDPRQACMGHESYKVGSTNPICNRRWACSLGAYVQPAARR